jgi:hypothetical protein
MTCGYIKVLGRKGDQESWKNDNTLSPKRGLTEGTVLCEIRRGAAHADIEFTRNEVHEIAGALGDYMPSADQACRFIKSNPSVSASFLIEHWRVSGDDDRCSNGKLRDIWKAAGGMVDKNKPGRVWIEADLLPGLLRLLAEIPNP